MEKVGWEWIEREINPDLTCQDDVGQVIELELVEM